MKEGGKYTIKKIGEDTPRRVEIPNRAGKATGKYKHAYNARELTDDWVDLKDYDVVEETEEELGADENEQRDHPVEEEEERDEETIYMEGHAISYGRREQSDINKMIDLAKEKELENLKENEVYEEVKKEEEEEGM